MPYKEHRRILPPGHHVVDKTSIRIIKRTEEGMEVVRIETTYHIKNYGNFTHYSPIVNTEDIL